MRLTLLAVVVGVVMTTGCSALLPPREDPCAPELSALSGAKAMKSLADSESLDSGVKLMNAQGDVLAATIAKGNAETELAGAKLRGGPDAATAARLNQAIADANARATTADAAVKAAQDDDTEAKALAATDAKKLTDAQDKLDQCRQQSGTR